VTVWESTKFEQCNSVVPETGSMTRCTKDRRHVDEHGDGRVTWPQADELAPVTIQDDQAHMYP
jgi:hypothetical protein